MGALALINHGLNFFAPALWLALLLPLVSRVFMKNKAQAQAFSGQVAIIFGVGGAVLVAGLVLFGRDGKMLTYLAFVLAVAVTQAVLSRR